MRQIREGLVGLVAAVASAIASVALVRQAVKKDEGASAPAANVEKEPRQDEKQVTPERAPQASASQHLSPTPQLRPGWHIPRPEELPAPTYWPIVMALGIMMLAWGVVTSVIISGVGLLLFGLALVGWIGELRHEDGSE